MALPILSSERFIFPSFCVTLGLLWCESKTSGEHVNTHKKLPNVLFIHLCPNYWVSGCGIELKDSLGMVFLIENKITFVLSWIIILLVVLHQVLCICPLYWWRIVFRTWCTGLGFIFLSKMWLNSKVGWDYFIF